MPLNQDLIKEVDKKLEQKIENIGFYKDQILLVDAEKELWDNGIARLDSYLLDKIETVNQSLYNVSTAYQNRIDSGCYTDLFWRIESTYPFPSLTYNLVVEKISIVGYGTTVLYVDNVGGITSYPPGSKFGFQTDNLHGLVYKDQPYLKDIGDTTIVSFVGQIGAGSTILTIISNNDVGIRSELSIGNLIISSKDGVFSGESNKIVGFGTTVFNSLEIESITGIATTSILTTTLILQNGAIGFSSVPESDGSYVSFTAVYDSDDYKDIKPRFKYSIPFTKNPFSPETVGFLTRNTVGIGYNIRYDNSGESTSTQSWKPEFEGVKNDDGDKIKRPVVGAGKTHYITGFPFYPIDESGNPAEIGYTRSVSTLLFGLYNNAPACSSEIISNLTNAEATRNAIESEFSSSYDSDFNLALKTDNLLRKERNQYALRIWTMRQTTGSENDDIDTYEEMKNYLGISTISTILQ